MVRSSVTFPTTEAFAPEARIAAIVFFLRERSQMCKIEVVCSCRIYSWTFQSYLLSDCGYPTHVLVQFDDEHRQLSSSTKLVSFRHGNLSTLACFNKRCLFNSSFMSNENIIFVFWVETNNKFFNCHCFTLVKSKKMAKLFWNKDVLSHSNVLSISAVSFSSHKSDIKVDKRRSLAVIWAFPVSCLVTFGACLSDATNFMGLQLSTLSFHCSYSAYSSKNGG